MSVLGNFGPKSTEWTSHRAVVTFESRDSPMRQFEIYCITAVCRVVGHLNCPDYGNPQTTASEMDTNPDPKITKLYKIHRLWLGGNASCSDLPALPEDSSRCHPKTRHSFSKWSFFFTCLPYKIIYFDGFFQPSFFSQHNKRCLLFKSDFPLINFSSAKHRFGECHKSQFFFCGIRHLNKFQ